MLMTAIVILLDVGIASLLQLIFANSELPNIAEYYPW